MSTEKFWAEADVTEMAELLKHIRKDHLKLTVNDLSRQIHMKVDTIDKCETGSSQHVSTALKKTCETFGLEYKILISTKQ